MNASAEPLVVGIIYPTTFWSDEDALRREISALEAVDPRVEVIVEEYTEPHALRSERSKQDGRDLRDQAPPLTDAQRRAFEKVEAVLTLDLPYDIADLAPRLRWVQGLGVGTGQLQSAGLAAAGIRLTNAAGSSAAGMSEFVFARILEHAKYLRELDEAQRTRRSEPRYGRLIEGLTIGLIGFGAINREVAARAKAFGMNVLALHRSTKPGEQHALADELFGPGELHAMLGRSDIVCAAVPETMETVGMIDAAALAAMKPGALFCNVGRGNLVDEPALIDALRSGHLGGAALDVTVREPVPPDDPLWDAPNLYLSPHCSTAAGELYPKVHRLFRENLARYVAGEPLVNEVDLSRGY